MQWSLARHSGLRERFRYSRRGESPQSASTRGDRTEAGGGKDAALEWPVKPSTAGYSITHSDELREAREGGVESGWVMHECEGLWAIWCIYG